jgi:hypothetical protein
MVPASFQLREIFLDAVPLGPVAFLEGLFQPTHLCILFVSLFLVLFPFWKITSKAGFPGWISLLILVPLVDIIFLFYLAFAEWPALKANLPPLPED